MTGNWSIHKCEFKEFKFYCAMRKLYINQTHKCCYFQWAGAHLGLTEVNWKTTVWACISAHSLDNLYNCEGTINAYIQALEKHMPPNRQYFFQ